MTLAAVIAEIQDEVGSVTGIRVAPDYPPDDLSIFPFAVCYPAMGTLIQEPPELMTGLHDIVIEIHVARKDLPRDVESVIGYVDTIPLELFGAIYNSAFSTIRTFEQIDYTFGVLDWTGTGEGTTIGWRFTLRAVKTQDAIT